MKKMILLVLAAAAFGACSAQTPAAPSSGPSKTPAAEAPAPKDPAQTSVPAPETPEPGNPQGFKVTADSGLSLRSGPSKEAPVLQVVPQGIRVEKLSEGSSAQIDGKTAPWFLVKLPSGSQGWMWSGYLEPEGSNPENQTRSGDEGLDPGISLADLQAQVYIQVVPQNGQWVVDYDPYGGPKTLTARGKELYLGKGQFAEVYDIQGFDVPVPGLMLLALKGRQGAANRSLEVGWSRELAGAVQYRDEERSQEIVLIPMDPKNYGHALDEASYPYKVRPADGPP